MNMKRCRPIVLWRRHDYLATTSTLNFAVGAISRPHGHNNALINATDRRAVHKHRGCVVLCTTRCLREHVRLVAVFLDELFSKRVNPTGGHGKPYVHQPRDISNTCVHPYTSRYKQVVLWTGMVFFCDMFLLCVFNDAENLSLCIED
jgi:hypothetical protein